MKAIRITALLATLCTACTLMAQPRTLADSLANKLNELDHELDRRDFYHYGHDCMLDSLRHEMEQATDLWKKYHLCGSLFYENLHYQADSSLYYVAKKQELLPALGRMDLMSEIHINRAEVLGVMGQYHEALNEMRQVDPNRLDKGTRTYYYSVMCTYYGWLADYANTTGLKESYDTQAMAYRDSVLDLLPPDVDHDIVFSEKLLLTREPSEVIGILERHLNNTRDKRQRIYLIHTLGEAYAAAGDTTRLMYCLADAAILDLQISVREYVALPKLAWELYRHGDAERAHRYMTCAMEDAAECNARLRFLSANQQYPIVDQALRDLKEADHRRTRTMLGITAILLLLLVMALAGLAWWMKKLADMRQALADANEHLQTANQHLEEMTEIKNSYLAHYLDRCVDYMERLEQYRKQLDKLGRAGKKEEMFKLIRSVTVMREERKEFYNEFDRSFLELFPNFVERFNALLEDDKHLYPRNGALLNTELRIFAMVRLGVTDMNRVAHFLGYSLTTVYNYRSRVRMMAKDKEHFDEELMKL